MGSQVGRQRSIYVDRISGQPSPALLKYLRRSGTSVKQLFGNARNSWRHPPPGTAPLHLPLPICFSRRASFYLSLSMLGRSLTTSAFWDLVRVAGWASLASRRMNQVWRTAWIRCYRQRESDVTDRTFFLLVSYPDLLFCIICGHDMLLRLCGSVLKDAAARMQHSMIGGMNGKSSIYGFYICPLYGIA